MAKYTVKCEKCGKEYQIELFGKMDRRDWVIEHGTHICDDCKAAERAAENAENAASNAEAGLPQLTGTEKQIAWAETIRAEKLAAFRAAGIKPEMLDKVIAVVFGETSASAWIDRRAADVRQLMTLNRDALMAIAK